MLFVYGEERGDDEGSTGGRCSCYGDEDDDDGDDDRSRIVFV